MEPIVSFERFRISDVYASVNGNRDPNYFFHLTGIVPGALIISRLENIVKKSIFSFKASFRNVLDVSGGSKDVAYMRDGDSFVIKDLGKKIADVEINLSLRDDLLKKLDKADLKSFPYELSWGNYDLFCQSLNVDIDPHSLLDKYDNKLPPLFGSYSFVCSSQQAKNNSQDLISAIKKVGSRFVKPEKTVIYMSQKMFADLDNAVSLPFNKDEDAELTLDIRGAYSKIKPSKNQVLVKYVSAIFNNDKPFIVGETVGCILFKETNTNFLKHLFKRVTEIFKYK